MLPSNLSRRSAEPALSRRAELSANGKFSNPVSESVTAVVVSFAMNLCEASPDETEGLRKEGLAILDTYHTIGRKAVDVWRPTSGDMDTLLQDPTITDICVIGEGGLGCVYVLGKAEDSSTGRAYDWISVANAADHLKTGDIYQRMCSVVSFSPVPWGTFAAADIHKIWISKEPLFVPKEVHSDPMTALMPAFQEGALSYDMLESNAERLRARDLM